MTAPANPWTPGPWWPGHLGNPDLGCECAYILSESYCGAVAEVHVDNGLNIAEGGNDAPPYNEAVANMRLIAAAPALYDALDECLGTLLEAFPGVASLPPIVRGRAALSKARGETP